MILSPLRQWLPADLGSLQQTYIYTGLLCYEQWLNLELEKFLPRMAQSKGSVLISGCSDGGMGAELAKEFHKAGFYVYATARTPSKMANLTALGIETLLLDIQSESSIQECVRKVSQIDILINNAGMQYAMPVSDISLSEAKSLFDTNVWGHIALTQQCIPHLRRSSRPMIVNHTSVGATMAMPFLSVYNASKAALSMFSDSMRLELQPFGITVVNLKTAAVRTNIINKLQAKEPELPVGSIYAPVRDVVLRSLRGDAMQDGGMSPERWAKDVVADLLKARPPPNIWRGESAWLVWVLGLLPFGMLDRMVKDMSGLNKVQKVMEKQECADP